MRHRAVFRSATSALSTFWAYDPESLVRPARDSAAEGRRRLGQHDVVLGRQGLDLAPGGRLERIVGVAVVEQLVVAGAGELEIQAGAAQQVARRRVRASLLIMMLMQAAADQDVAAARRLPGCPRRWPPIRTSLPVPAIMASPAAAQAADHQVVALAALEDVAARALLEHELARLGVERGVAADEQVAAVAGVELRVARAGDQDVVAGRLLPQPGHQRVGRRGAARNRTARSRPRGY